MENGLKGIVPHFIEGNAVGVIVFALLLIQETGVIPHIKAKMDKKIKKIMHENKEQGSELKSLLKADKKNDKIVDRAKKMKDKC